VSNRPDKLVEEDGGVVLVSDTERIWPATGPWQEAVRNVIHTWLGPQRRAGTEYWNVSHDPFKVILERSPFSRVEPYRLTVQREVTLDEIIGYLYSTSYCSPKVLGELREPFEKDLRRTLFDLNSTGRFLESAEFGALLAHR
jgi:hypothetical protein